MDDADLAHRLEDADGRMAKVFALTIHDARRSSGRYTPPILNEHMFSYNSRQDPGGTDAAAQKNAPPPNGEGRRSLLRAPREREVGRLAVAGCGPAACRPALKRHSTDFSYRLRSDLAARPGRHEVPR